MYEEIFRQIIPGATAGLIVGLIIAAVVVFIIALLFIIAIYIYTSWAMYVIAKKLKYKKAWLAWIPVANLFLLPILAKWKWGYGFLLLIPIANLVFAIIWTWEIYKRRGYSGALSIVKAFYVVPPLIPAVFIADMIILGIVAFEK
ncbi:MAG: hypothetical protein WCX82_00735 [archaeon]|jgi:hypothetical protein